MTKLFAKRLYAAPPSAIACCTRLGSRCSRAPQHHHPETVLHKAPRAKHVFHWVAGHFTDRRRSQLVQRTRSFRKLRRLFPPPLKFRVKLQRLLLELPKATRHQRRNVPSA